MNAATGPAYAEFAVQSNFSFLHGASRPEELVVAGEKLGFAALGLADRNTVAGVVRAWQQSKVGKIAFHPGCRLVFADETPDMLAYPQSRKGWGHLCRMLTQANFRGEKGAPHLLQGDLLEWGDLISFAVLPDFMQPADETLPFLRNLKHRFSGQIRLGLAPNYSGDRQFAMGQAKALSEASSLPLMAVADALYHTQERRPLQDTLTAIRLNVPVSEAGFALAANAERHLKPARELARLFRDIPQALSETLRFAETLEFSLKDLEFNYPDEPSESGLPPQDELERLTWEGARERYPDDVPENVIGHIRHELGVIQRLGYAKYFLTVHDIVKFARSQGVLCQGRGSAANSVICFCIGITDVGPDVIDVLFERFISEKRGEPPDIDVDFEHEKRDVVIEYIYKKYSEKHTSLACSVITYRGRSALRQVGKAMGLSEDVTAALSGSIWGWSTEKLGERETKAAGLGETDLITRNVVERANEILEFPRHLSQHVGGFVITKDRLDEIVPIVKTGMDERKMVEWDKDDLDAVKILKVDILALGMLSCLRRAFDLLESHYPDMRDPYGRPYRLATLPAGDKHVYDMICRADTLGVFQIESRAQMSMLPRLRPRTFYDLVIEVAIVRPGPIQGDMVHPYLRRRQDKEKPEYPKPELEKILSRTLGVPLFQEQAMKIAIVAGGFSADEADQLRRAMATFKRTGTIGNYRERLIDGMVSRGYEPSFADRCFKQIEGFGEYGFPESHAASFALLVYASCWFKAFFPDVFCAAILNSQPMGFYAPAQLIRDAQDHGVSVFPVDINWSDWDCTLVSSPFDASGISPRHADMHGVIKSRHAVQLGFRQVHGLPDKAMQAFVERRGTGYTSVHDAWMRSGLHRRDMELLARADAFRSIGLDRRDALWAVRALDAKSDDHSLPMFDRPGLQLRDLEPQASLPLMPPSQHVIDDYRAMGMSLKAHPVSFFRSRLDAQGVTPNKHLPGIHSGRRISVAGLVLVRQRPGSAKGVIFMTLEDEVSISNVIVWRKTFERYRSVVMGARFVRVHGKLQSESDVIHIVADHIEDLTPWLSDLSEHAATIEPYGPADEVKHGGHDHRSRNMRRHHLHHAVEAAVKEEQRHEDLARNAHDVMPKGRNFH